MLAIVAPGQGAQTPGFLSPWTSDDAAAELLGGFGEAAGLDLVHAGTAADADAIRDTAVAQPLLVAAGLVAARALLDGAAPADGTVLAGHSVGEVVAVALAGVLTDVEAMRFVGDRGRAMAAAAAAAGDTGMTAVVGGVRDQVLAAIDAAGLTAANDNGPGQIVAAGTAAQLAALAAAPPERARLIPLEVAGAFHTVHMRPAVLELAAVADELAPADPAAGLTLLSNADGEQVTGGADALARLVAQVGQSVRWDRCLEAMAAAGVTGLLELTPAGTLLGIARRHLKGVETFALNTPDDLDEAHAFVARHAC